MNFREFCLRKFKEGNNVRLLERRSKVIVEFIGRVLLDQMLQEVGGRQ